MVLPLADHANEQNDYMWNHAPNDYLLSVLQNIASGEGSFPVEILHRYDDVVVKMNPRWRRDNPGAALVIPIERGLRHQRSANLSMHCKCGVQIVVIASTV